MAVDAFEIECEAILMAERENDEDQAFSFSESEPEAPPGTSEDEDPSDRAQSPALSETDLANQAPAWYSSAFGNTSKSGPSKPKRARKRSRELTDSEDSDLENSEPASKRDVKTMEGLLRKLCRKVAVTQRQLKEIQPSRSSTSESDASSAGCTPPSKRRIPLFVRQEVRKVYNALCDDEENNFDGWIIAPGKTIKSPENRRAIDKVVMEVKALNPTFTSSDIREAAYRYYKSKREEQSSKRRGLDVSLKKNKRKRERMLRKRKDRELAITKNVRLSADAKEKWLKVMKNEFMSSEESGSDEETLIVRPLPWRSNYVNNMFKRIDTYCSAKKSPQARRQLKKRRSGPDSDRPAPLEDVPDWATESTQLT